jgi:phosphoribosylamine--glycine ligase
MNVLIIDSDHVGLDFAMRAAAADHAVRLFRYSKKPTRYAEGFGKFFELVDDWRPSMAWAKDGLILVTANNRYITELDRYREFGFKNIFGPTVASSRLEIMRSAGMEAMQAIGIDVPPYQTFDSLDAAEAFARKSDRAWVFKPMGDEEDKSLTYVSKDPADLVGWLQRQMKLGKKLAGKAMLQEKVDRLAEIGVSGWMGPEGFLPECFEVCHEHKPLFPGDIGPATGEQGTVMAYTEKDKLAEQMLLPLEPVLRTLGHRGDFAVGAMVDTKGKAHFLEFTARCGYPAWYIQAASHRGDPVKWMKDLLDGKDSLKVSYDVAIGVVLAHPDYPYDNARPEMVEGIPIRGAEAVLPDLHLVEAMLGKGPVMENGKVADRPTYETAGTYIAVATALGKTVQKAREKVYSIVKSVHYPDVMYRNDIGSRLEQELPKLHRFGYAVDIRWQTGGDSS